MGAGFVANASCTTAVDLVVRDEKVDDGDELGDRNRLWVEEGDGILEKSERSDDVILNEGEGDRLVVRRCSVISSALVVDKRAAFLVIYGGRVEEMDGICASV